jgi:hypothetical protein
VGTEKYLTINIKYYSTKHNKILTRFLSFLRVEGTTADELYDPEKSNLQMKNILEIGTDGANNTCGKFTSLYSRIRDNNNSDLILVNCVCHSLHLCASEVFDDKINFLLRETYSWFSNSTLRMAQYKRLYELQLNSV